MHITQSITKKKMAVRFKLFCVPSTKTLRCVFTHVDQHGKVSMVNVSEKTPTVRSAIASGRIWLGKEAFDLLKTNNISKGDVLTVAKIAGINAAKHTSLLIPLCHNIAISHVDVSFVLEDETDSVSITATATTTDRTGIEMEAMTSASVAALTIYDMCKSVAKTAVISDIRLDRKTGGRSGDFQRGSQSTADANALHSPTNV